MQREKSGLKWFTSYKNGAEHIECFTKNKENFTVNNLL